MKRDSVSLQSNTLTLFLQRMVEPDEDGWVYSDHKWENEQRASDSPEPVTSSMSVHSQKDSRSRNLTRRRRWFRTASKIHKTY
jgi:hypothetical protein